MADNIEEVLQKNLKKFFNFESFKSEKQRHATTSVMLRMMLEELNVVINLPPVAGKSICFQLPTMSLEKKITIVIVPDEHTAEEQINFLAEHQIKVFYVYSKTCQIDLSELIEEFIMKMNLKFIYVTSDMLQKKWFQMLMKDMSTFEIIASIVIDEAHCISEYYGKLIPSYRKIYELQRIFPQTPFIALTSVGSTKILIDIEKCLNFGIPKIISHKNWQLSNIYLQVRFKDILTNPLNDMKSLIKNFMDTSKKFSGIICCSNCDEVIKVTQELTLLNIPIAAYCPKLGEYERNQNEQNWLNGKIKMLAVTSDLGMKLSVHSVRCIIHWTIPINIEQYYQFIGKYSRHNKPILCRLYFSLEDWINNQLITMTMPNRVFKHCAKIVDYCIFSRCRHQFFSKYFGVRKNPCGNACDYCEKECFVESQQKMTQQFMNQYNGFSKIINLRSSKVYKVNHTNRVKNLTILQRYSHYKNLKNALLRNYKNVYSEDKPKVKIQALRHFTRGLEFSIFTTSHKQRDYYNKMMQLITNIDNTTESKEISNYIINYMYMCAMQ